MNAYRFSSGEEPTDEPNGLYIRIPVNRDMPNRFYEEAVDYLSQTHPDWDFDSELVYRFMMAVRRRVK